MVLPPNRYSTTDASSPQISLRFLADHDPGGSIL
jgi:hypothetical protein